MAHGPLHSGLQATLDHKASDRTLNQCPPKRSLSPKMRTAQPGFFLVRGFNLRYHNKETMLFTTDPQYGYCNFEKNPNKKPATVQCADRHPTVDTDVPRV